MKKIIALGLAAVLSMGVCFMPVKVNAETAPVVSSYVGRVSVSGQGKVNVKPDIATLSASVTNVNIDAKAAQAENTKKMNAVIDAVKALKIDAKDIVTSNYSMYEEYSWDNNSRKLIGYRVTNTITVTIRDISLVGDVISVTTKAGANVTSGIQFSISDSTKAYAEALQIAVANAKGTANVIASALGVKITGIETVSESGYNYYPVNYKNDFAVAETAMADAAPAPQIESGELTVNASVSIVFTFNN